MPNIPTAPTPAAQAALLNRHRRDISPDHRIVMILSFHLPLPGSLPGLHAKQKPKLLCSALIEIKSCRREHQSWLYSVSKSFTLPHGASKSFGLPSIAAMHQFGRGQAAESLAPQDRRSPRRA
jgi:hypothetical protein